MPLPGLVIVGGLYSSANCVNVVLFNAQGNLLPIHNHPVDIALRDKHNMVSLPCSSVELDAYVLQTSFTEAMQKYSTTPLVVLPLPHTAFIDIAMPSFKASGAQIQRPSSIRSDQCQKT